MRTISLVALSMLASVMLVGCGLETSRVDADFGTSYQLAKANQILNPDADKNLEPVMGISGEVGKRVTDKYTQGFEKEVATPTYIFNLGR